MLHSPSKKRMVRDNDKHHVIKTLKKNYYDAPSIGIMEPTKKVMKKILKKYKEAAQPSC